MDLLLCPINSVVAVLTNIIIGMCILIQRYFIMFAPKQKLGKISTVKVFTVEWGVGWVSKIVKPGFGEVTTIIDLKFLAPSFLIVIYCGRLHQVV